MGYSQERVYEVGVHSLKWKVSREWSPTKEMKAESQTLRSVGSAKFNVDGAQLNASEVSQVSVVFFITSTERSCFPSMWEKNPMKLRRQLFQKFLIYLDTFHDKLIVESDSSNAISKVNLLLRAYKKFQFYFNDQTSHH